MPGSAVFDVILGLLLTYFLLSLICSALNEAVTGLFRYRARFLSQQMERLLGAQLQNFLYQHPLIRGLSSPSVGVTEEAAPPATIKRPSYIPAQTFARALQAVVSRLEPTGEGGVALGAAEPEAPALAEAVGNGINLIPNEGLRQALKGMLADAADDLDAWRKRVEMWFDDSMERLSGWYKRKVKWFIFVFAIGVTLALNADSVLFVKTLWTDESLRTTVAARAQTATDTPIPCPTPTESEGPDPLDLDCVAQRVQASKELGVPLGWPNLNWRNWATTDAADRRVPHNMAEAWLKLLGLVLTIAALSRGAPFWFELLNKVANFRASGPPPKKASEASEG